MSKPQPTSAPPQTSIEFPTPEQEELDISTLETWLWDAACVIRGATDASKFKDFILPLIFYKRLSDVFDDEFAERVVEFGDEEAAREIIEADHEDALKSERGSIVRFYIQQKYSWKQLRNHPADGGLGEFVTEAMREVARMNPPLRGVRLGGAHGRNRARSSPAGHAEEVGIHIHKRTIDVEHGVARPADGVGGVCDCA